MTTTTTTSRQCLVLILVVVSLLPLVVTGDWFDSFDANHDGFIDRGEYDAGMLKLSSALQGESSPLIRSMSSFSWPNLHQTEGFWNAFSSGIAMILATEVGDKTFFIAAVLSMRHDRSAVFGGAILALVIMTILSSAMGVVLPKILPKEYTHLLGGLLFLYFGFKLILDSRKMTHQHSEELEEVEEELAEKSKKGDEEEGQMKKSSTAPTKKASWSQVVIQALTLTFLAEWGDRSQIATIALASHKNPYGVTIGGCIGHSLCTGLAVIGGRMLAARISEKSVAFYGGCIFLVFGLHSIFWES